MCRTSIRESVMWVDCPFCKEERVIQKVSLELTPDGEETNTTKKWGTPSFLTKDHAITCQKLVGTFKQRQEKFAKHFQKKLVKKNFKSHAEV